MGGTILRKEVKDVAGEEWGWVAGRVVSFCNLEVTKVAEFGSSVSLRTLGLVTGAEEDRDINMMTNGMSDSQSKSIYINHHLVNSVKNIEMIT